VTPAQRKAARAKLERTGRSGELGEIAAVASAALGDLGKLRQAVTDALCIIGDGSLPTTGQAVRLLRDALARGDDLTAGLPEGEL